MEVLIIALILNVIGRILKKIKFITNNYIPVILIILGCLLCWGYYGLIVGVVDWNDVLINGMLASTSSVYIYEVVKQIIEVLPLKPEAKAVIQAIFVGLSNKES